MKPPVIDQFRDMLGRPIDALPCFEVVAEALHRLGFHVPLGALPVTNKDYTEALAQAHEMDSPWVRTSRTLGKLRAGDVVLTRNSDRTHHLSVCIEPHVLLTTTKRDGCRRFRAGHLRNVLGVYRLRDRLPAEART